MNGTLRLLSASLLAVVVAVVVAGYALFASLEAAHDERNLLLDIVCESVNLRIDYSVETAEEWLRRVNEILARHGEQGRCGP